MRVAAVISSLQAGGAERVMTQLLNHWVQAGGDVTVLTFEPPGTPPFYPLDPRVRHQPLALAGTSANLREAIGGNLRRMRTLRRALDDFRPEAVVSFCAQTNVLVLAATRGSGWKVFVSERADPAMHRIGRFWSWGRRVLYPTAGGVVVQTKEAADFFPRALRRRITVIPNPVEPVPPPTQPPARLARILAVGRLAPQKGFDQLIEAFALVHREFPGWTLRIVGEGPERGDLARRAAERGVADQLELPGLIRGIGEEYARAAVFVMPSRYEGFPNALCEAMAAGLPVAAFACPGGVEEIVESERNGLLVPAGDIPSLAASMAKLMRSEETRRRLGESAARLSERYAPVRIFARWDSLLGEGAVSR